MANTSTSRFLVLLPRSVHMQDLMSILEDLCMLLLTVLNRTAVERFQRHVFTQSRSSPKAPKAPVVHLPKCLGVFPNPAMLNRQGVSTHPKMKN